MMTKIRRALLKGMLCACSVLLLLVLIGTEALAADEHPAVDVTDGESFVAALGGEDKATCATEDGVCTITLLDDVELGTIVRISAGSYVIEGSSTISRAEGYAYVVLDVMSGASVEISDSVVVDGGAVWTRGGEPTDSAVGATNEGVVAEASMLDVREGQGDGGRQRQLPQRQQDRQGEDQGEVADGKSLPSRIRKAPQSRRRRGQHG